MIKIAEDSVFRIRNYRWYWVTRQLVGAARQMTTVAIGWHGYDVARTGTELGGLGMNEANAAFMLGLLGLAQYLPVLLLSLIGGQAADRLNRQHIMLVAGIFRALCLALLCATPFMPTQWVFLILIFVSVCFGIANAFFPAASHSLFPTLVTKEQLPKAIVWNTMGMQIAGVGGPVIAGLAIIVSQFFAYLIPTVLLIGSILSVIRIRPPKHVPKEHADTWGLVLEGLKYVWTNKIVLGAISLDFIVVFFAGSIALLPVFARDILHVGAFGNGVLRAAIAVGAVCVAITLSNVSFKRNIGRWMFTAVIIMGLGIIVFGLSRNLWLSALALAVYGGADMISMYIRQSLLQLSTPDDMKGRVASTSFIFIASSNELGEFQSGVAAKLLGPINAVLFGGAVAIIASLSWMGLFPRLRKADRFEDIEEQDVEPTTNRP